MPSVGPTFAPITATAAPIHSFAATAAPVHSFAATAAPVHSYAAQTYSALASPVQAIPASYQASYPAFTYREFSLNQISSGFNANFVDIQLTKNCANCLYIFIVYQSK